MRAEKIGGLSLESMGSNNANNRLTLPRNRNIVPEWVNYNTYRRSADGTLLIDEKYRLNTWNLTYEYMTNDDLMKLIRILRSDDSTVTPGYRGQIVLFGIDVMDFTVANNIYNLRYCICTKFPSPKIIGWDYSKGLIVGIEDQYETYEPVFGDISFTLEEYEVF